VTGRGRKALECRHSIRDGLAQAHGSSGSKRPRRPARVACLAGARSPAPEAVERVKTRSGRATAANQARRIQVGRRPGSSRSANPNTFKAPGRGNSEPKHGGARVHGPGPHRPSATGLEFGTQPLRAVVLITGPLWRDAMLQIAARYRLDDVLRCDLDLPRAGPEARRAPDAGTRQRRRSGWPDRRRCTRP
jgi:hypothetical protein